MENIFSVFPLSYSLGEMVCLLEFLEEFCLQGGVRIMINVVGNVVMHAEAFSRGLEKIVCLA